MNTSLILEINQFSKELQVSFEQVFILRKIVQKH